MIFKIILLVVVVLVVLFFAFRKKIAEYYIIDDEGIVRQVAKDHTKDNISTKLYLNPKTYILNSEGLPVKKVMDHDSALQYILAWKEYDDIRESSYKLIDTPSHIRADVGSLEFESNDKDHMLIVRYWISDLHKADPKFRTALMTRLEDVKKRKEGLAASFGDAYIEDDTTSAELDSEHPERLNLRLDIKDASLSVKEAVDIFDNFSSLGHAFDVSDYQRIYTETSKQVFGE